MWGITGRRCCLLLLQCYLKSCINQELYICRCGYDAHVSDCVRCYTRDWLHVSRQYLHHSTSVPGHGQLVTEQLPALQAGPQPEFEVDLEDEDHSLGDGDRVSTV